jgi:hypothetical protein
MIAKPALEVKQKTRPLRLLVEMPVTAHAENSYLLIIKDLRRLGLLREFAEMPADLLVLNRGQPPIYAFSVSRISLSWADRLAGGAVGDPACVRAC